MPAYQPFLLLLASLTSLSVLAVELNTNESSPPAADAPASQASAEPVPEGVLDRARNEENPTSGSAAAASTEVSTDAPVLEAAQIEEVEDVPVSAWRLQPRLFLFDYDNGADADRAHFLERYDVREGHSGSTRSGAYADLDVGLTYGNLARDILVLDRQGFGEHNHRGEGRYNTDKIGVMGSYSHHRTTTGGIEYLFNPEQVADYTQINPDPGDTIVDDTTSTDFHVDRTTYAAGLTIKPAVLGGWGKITVDYQGYQRDGSKYAPYFLASGSGSGGGGNGSSGGGDTWRAVSLGIDERMNRVSFKFDALPKDLFSINYKVTLEKFVNEAADLTLGDISTNGVSGQQALEPFFYIPDTTFLSHTIQLSKNFLEQLLVAVGYSHASLSDDSTGSTYESSPISTSWKGKMSSNSAFLNANWRISPDLGMEGFVKHYQRDNDSTYPASGVIASTDLLGPYIKSIDSQDYGLAVNWRPGLLGSTVAFGWRRLDRQRDLIYGQIEPAQTLYREDTLADEIYLKWVARPAAGWTLRLTPSYTWSDSTGLVTEPEESFLIKALASYTATEGWMVNGFYDYRRKLNSNNTFTDGDSGSGTPLTYTQDIDSTLHSAGLSLNVMPRDDLTAFVNLFWVQDDLSSYLFTTRSTRWTPSVEFTLVDKPNYKIDTYSIGLGVDWQANDTIKFNASYTYSRSRGDVASGTVLTSIEDTTGTVDARIDNYLHSFVLGADYVLSPKATLRASYVFDDYVDKAYGLLTGRVHTLVLGVMLGF